MYKKYKLQLLEIVVHAFMYKNNEERHFSYLVKLLNIR